MADAWRFVSLPRHLHHITWACDPDTLRPAMPHRYANNHSHPVETYVQTLSAVSWHVSPRRKASLWLPEQDLSSMKVGNPLTTCPLFRLGTGSCISVHLLLQS